MPLKIGINLLWSHTPVGVRPIYWDVNLFAGKIIVKNSAHIRNLEYYEVSFLSVFFEKGYGSPKITLYREMALAPEAFNVNQNKAGE